MAVARTDAEKSNRLEQKTSDHYHLKGSNIQKWDEGLTKPGLERQKIKKGGPREKGATSETHMKRFRSSGATAENFLRQGKLRLPTNSEQNRLEKKGF